MTAAMKTVDAGLWVILIVGIWYLISKSVLSSDPPSDYQFIWLAGEMWRAGLNPYSDLYLERGIEKFPFIHQPYMWFYPPSWFPVAWVTAAIPFEISLILWRSLGAFFLVSGILILARSIHRSFNPLTKNWVIGALVFGCLQSATPIAMALGQTTFVSFLGLVLFLVAYIERRKFLMGFALVILMLKPQFGLPFCFFLLVDRQWFFVLTGAAAVSILAALPAFLYVDPTEFFSTYFENFSIYKEFEPNHPRSMTGIENLAYDLAGLFLSSIPLVLTACGLAAVVGIWAKRSARNSAIGLTLLLVMVLFFVPLHTYDMVLIVPIILLYSQRPLLPKLVIGSGLLLIFRANNVALETGFFDQATTHFVGSRVVSIGLFLVLVGVFLAAVNLLREKKAE